VKPVVYKPTGDIRAPGYRMFTVGQSEVVVSYTETDDAFVVSAITTAWTWSRGAHCRTCQWRSIDWLKAQGVNAEALAAVLSQKDGSDGRD
jgi:hypothetical protein